MRTPQLIDAKVAEVRFDQPFEGALDLVGAAGVSSQFCNSAVITLIKHVTDGEFVGALPLFVGRIDAASQVQHCRHRKLACAGQGQDVADPGYRRSLAGRCGLPAPSVSFCGFPRAIAQRERFQARYLHDHIETFGAMIWNF